MTKWGNQYSKQKYTTRDKGGKRTTVAKRVAVGTDAIVVERKKAREIEAAIIFVSTSDWLNQLHVYSNFLAHMAQIWKTLKSWEIPKFMQKHYFLRPVSILAHSQLIADDSQWYLAILVSLCYCGA